MSEEFDKEKKPKKDKAPKEHKQHEHVFTAEELGAKLEQNENSGKRIMQIVSAFLVVVFFAGMIWGANDILSREGQWPPVPPLHETITNPPAATEERYAWLEDAVADALSVNPQVKDKTVYEIFRDDSDEKYLDTLTFTGEDSTRLAAGIKLVSEQIEAKLNDELFAEKAHPYKADLSKLLRAVLVQPADISESACEYIYYKCKACGKEEGEPKEECPDCHAKNAFEIKYRDNYTLKFFVPDDSVLIDEQFKTPDAQAVTDFLKPYFTEFMPLKTADAGLRNNVIIADVGREDRKLKNLRFESDMDLSVGFEDGNNASMTLLQKREFHITWPGISLSSSELTLNKRASSRVTAAVNGPEAELTPVTYTSSDESVVTVDSEGYLKAGNKFGEAAITASFDYFGETLTSECKIHVKIPVEQIKLNRRNLKLAAGEMKQLTAKVSPWNATYKSVTWTSEDETIATVSANGLITAVAPGEVKIIALTDDEYFRGTCTVTVKEGN